MIHLKTQIATIKYASNNHNSSFGMKQLLEIYNKDLSNSLELCLACN